MRKLTQTSLDPGNCWQTCIACILDLDPEAPPPQVDYDKREPVEGVGFCHIGPSYMSVLQRYLRKHHGLAYVEIHYPPEVYSALAIRDGLHMMTGRTVRSATNGNQRHVVVGIDGRMYWDPHPSRAGLTEDINNAFLIPFPKSWEASWNRDNNGDCVCRACATHALGDTR